MSLAEMPAADCPVQLDGDRLTLVEVAGIARRNRPVALAANARRKIQASRAVVEEMIRDGRAVYGLTTGFGLLSEVAVSPAEAATLHGSPSGSRGRGRGVAGLIWEENLDVNLTGLTGFSGAIEIRWDLQD